MQAEQYCRELSLAAGEPLSGTAAEAEHWLFVEHDAAWGPKGVEDSQLPHQVLAHLQGLASSLPSLRLQLARKPEGSAPGCRVFFATVRQGARSLHELTFSSVDELVQLDLSPLLRGEQPAHARELREPYFFVCVHGKRDRCCAQRGMPLYSELSAIAPARTFITTHLGGHRFAATMVVLPHGVCYGRVEAAEAAQIVAAHDREEIFALDRMRGNVGYESEAQAAEVAIREQLGERALDALTLLRNEPVGDMREVTFLHVPTGQEHTRTISSLAMPPLVQSCGAGAKPAHRLVVYP